MQLTAPDGNRISKRFPDPDSAVAWKNATLSSFSQGRYIPPVNTTVKAWLIQWLEDYIKPKRKARTWEAYQSLFDNHLKDIYAIPMQEIVSYHITKVYNNMRKKKKSEATILKLHNVLHNAFNVARFNKIIATNIIEDVERPQAEKTETVKLEENDILKLLGGLKGTRIYAGVFLIAHTGMRLGEALGVRWIDIDYDESSITISQNLQRSKTNGLRGEKPKTETSFRKIFVGDEVLDVLRDERTRQLAGKKTKESKTVVCNRLGKSLEPRRFNKEFDAVRKELGMDTATRHGLRHAIASILIDKGVPVTEVAALLGHADKSFTYRKYVHERKDATKKAASVISETLHPKKKIKIMKISKRVIKRKIKKAPEE